MKTAPPDIDAPLAAALAAREEGPFPVVVTFRDDDPGRDLGALGLYGGGGPAAIGYGTLAAAAIRRLMLWPEVAAIRLMPAVPAAPPPAESPLAVDTKVIEPALAETLAAHPGDGAAIVVTFRVAPPDDAVAALGLQALGGGMATGWLEPAAIRGLARRADVARIAWLQPPTITAP